jgi:pyroglutamyl-peptidase
MKILVSGFEPIWGIKKTPSGELAKLWQSGDMPVSHGAEVKSVILPQQFGLCTEIICNEIAAFQPNGIIMFGSTPKNDPIRLERFAINCERSPMGDNTRIPVKDRPVVPGGPSAYESTLPVYHLVDRLKAHGIEAKASYHAGTHVCNSILYGVMHWLTTTQQKQRVSTGFVHVAFPNEFGVVEDELWDTASWPHLVQSSVVLLNELVAWLGSQKDTL